MCVMRTIIIIKESKYDDAPGLISLRIGKPGGCCAVVAALFGDLVGADGLCHTVSPSLEGGVGLQIVTARDAMGLPSFVLDLYLLSDDMLLTKWSLHGDPRDQARQPYLGSRQCSIFW